MIQLNSPPLPLKPYKESRENEKISEVMKVINCWYRCQCNLHRDVSNCLEFPPKKIFFTDYNYKLIIFYIFIISKRFDNVIEVLKSRLLLKISENLMLVIFKLRMDIKRKTSAPKSEKKR